MSVKEVLIILLLQIIYSQAITLSSSAKEQLVIDDDAIRKLSEIFDIPNLKGRRDVAADIFMSVNTTAGDMGYAIKKATWPRPGSSSEPEKTRPDQTKQPQPPQYMINLFNTIADRNGIMRIPNPYHANLIKSFPNKDMKGEGGLNFDLSSVHFGQTILQAELHLQLTTRPNNISALDQPSVLMKTSVGVADHLLIEVYLIENIFPLRKRLIAKKSLTVAPGDTWQNNNLSDVLTIRPAVLQWINRPHHNFGLQVVVSSNVKDAAGNLLHFHLNNEPSRVALLILFMDDGRPQRNPKYRIKSWAKQNEFLKSRLTRLGQADLYHSYTAADQLQSSLPIRPSSSQDLDSQDILRIFPLQSSRVKRSPKLAKERSSPRKKASVKKFRRRGQQKGLRGSCRRHELYVSFEEIGWSSWIISPKGFQAFHCRGDCHFPIGQDSKPSNHATVISIINHLKLHKNVAAPCCVPEKLYSISLLYFDNEQNVILKQYDDMVAQSCACR